MWQALLKMLVSDNNSHWIDIADTFFAPKNVPFEAVTRADCQDFLLYGYVVRLALIWKLDIFVISPFFLALLLGDITTAMSSSFTKIVSPAADARLRTWPPQEALNPTQDPFVLLTQCSVAFTDVSIFDFVTRVSCIYLVCRWRT